LAVACPAFWILFKQEPWAEFVLAKALAKKLNLRYTKDSQIDQFIIGFYFTPHLI